MAEPADAGAGDAKVWKTAADADIASELPFSGPILSQGEIDSLLGFARGEEASIWRGQSAIVYSTCAPYERLPTLEGALDRLARLMSTSLRSFMSGNVEVSIEQIASIGFGDPDPMPLPAIMAVFRAGQIGNFGLVAVDDNLIHSAVVALLGARRGGLPTRVEDRPYTAIERTLVARMIEVVLADAREAFSPLTEEDFQLDRIETDPRFAAMARPDDAIVVKLRIGMANGGGRLELALPYGAMAPIREDCCRKAQA